ncbi:MAG: hypothetical protein ACP5SB_05455 [Caldisericaceae bacterium]
MIIKKITRRQMDFLETVVALHNETNSPVSYKAVAATLGLSKWTAYDVLQTLFKKGFLSAKYSHSGGPGRSTILYEPNQDAIESLKNAKLSTPSSTIDKWFLQTQEKVSKLPVHSAIRFVLKRMKDEQNPLNIVLYTLILAIILAKVFESEINAMVNMNAIINLNAYAPAVLMFFVESVFGILQENRNSGKIKLEDADFTRISDILNKFRESVSELSPLFQDRILKLILL